MSKTVLDCQQCGLPFFRTCKDKKTRRFCSRDCYKIASRKLDQVPYPRIWFNGKREYLHRVIYIQATGESLSGNDIIHHIDENPFNRSPENLEKLTGRAAHLHKHNYHRRGNWTQDDEIPF